MAYASISGRARTSAKSPRAFAVCMRCGIWYNRDALQFQFDWAGSQLQNKYILVCKRCLDKPQEQKRAITLPADPNPVYFPSVEDFEADETNYRTISQPAVTDPITGIPIPGTTRRITQDYQNRTINPFGLPVGFDQNAVMPLVGVKHYGVPLELLSVTSDGSATVQVTCSKAHGLTADSEVSIRGLSNNAANGFYSIDVLSAMAFRYMCYGSINAAALLTPTTRIITALIGIPLGYKRIPKIWGPPLYPGGTPTTVCFLATESGGMFQLEDGSGYIQLQSCNQPGDADVFELESGAGSLSLENGNGFLELEIGP